MGGNVKIQSCRPSRSKKFFYALSYYSIPCSLSCNVNKDAHTVELEILDYPKLQFFSRLEAFDEIFFKFIQVFKRNTVSLGFRIFWWDGVLKLAGVHRYDIRSIVHAEWHDYIFIVCTSIGHLNADHSDRYEVDTTNSSFTQNLSPKLCCYIVESFNRNFLLIHPHNSITCIEQ